MRMRGEMFDERIQRMRQLSRHVAELPMRKSERCREGEFVQDWSREGTGESQQNQNEDFYFDVLADESGEGPSSSNATSGEECSYANLYFGEDLGYGRNELKPGAVIDMTSE
ncbi:hypothetical protein OESDEN_03625 [Oesophagostomum dentatum]|uniref:Uncharacterized protein n=1 Tax=Oesophagostomum dentatum TaxID=61180 RepID=A0A0B1TJY0_OESDE|nr:hypothetical protein OESDEN_03625 [Oesophagostomum dentatum]